MRSSVRLQAAILAILALSGGCGRHMLNPFAPQVGAPASGLTLAPPPLPHRARSR